MRPCITNYVHRSHPYGLGPQVMKMCYSTHALRDFLVHTSHHSVAVVAPSDPPPSPLPLQSLLLLRTQRHRPPLDQHALLAADLVHVPLGDVLAVAKLAQVLHLLLGEGHPEGVLVQDLEAGEDELGLGGARRPLAHVVGEAEGLGHGEERLDREEGRALVHGLGEDAAAPAGQDVVDPA